MLRTHPAHLAGIVEVTHTTRQGRCLSGVSPSFGYKRGLCIEVADHLRQ